MVTHRWWVDSGVTACSELEHDVPAEWQAEPQRRFMSANNTGDGMQACVMIHRPVTLVFFFRMWYALAVLETVNQNQACQAINGLYLSLACHGFEIHPIKLTP